MKLFLKIAFLGTAYCGYQVQNNARSIQQVMNETAYKLFGYECDVVGCSRTDSGVHANEFCLTVSKKGENKLEHGIPIEKIPIAFNSLLPNDVSVFYSEMVPDDFHARYDVKFKEYVYKMWNGKVKNPFLADRAFSLPFFVDDEAVALMDLAARDFVGTHDFTAFMAQGSKITDATRTVYYAKVYKEGDLIVFKVAADGFLYNMVRIMVGTLVDIARQKAYESKISQIIEKKERKYAGATAPACGLYLNKVSYVNYER